MCLSNGVMVAHLILVQPVEVRVLVRQQTLRKLRLAESLFFAMSYALLLQAPSGAQILRFIYFELC